MSKHVIVTGGGGFVGEALCRRLVGLGYRVTSIARGSYPELENCGVNVVQHDLSQPLTSILPQLEGANAIFHTAAYVKMWGKYQDFYQVNVVATKQLLAAAKELKIENFIYTSSPSVIADGRDLCGINESYPYPVKHKAFYPQTKAIAEQMVLAANGQELNTLSLRPHLIWGPGDRNFVPTILERARAGKLMCIGDGQNKVDVCYIDDCVTAHIRALEALKENPKSRGKAYFISQGEPVKLWEWINQILELHDLPQITKKVPFGIAYPAAAILETVSRLMPGQPEPRFTKFLVSEMATDHYFDLSRAKDLLGFEPKVSIKVAMERTFSSDNRQERVAA